MVFSIAFVLGVGRTLVIAPLVGPTLGVMIEIPFLLGTSWFVAARILRGKDLKLGQRALMGAVALMLTLASEVVLAGLLRGQTPAHWAASVATPLGLLGLTGQIAFAVVPMAAGSQRIASPASRG